MKEGTAEATLAGCRQEPGAEWLCTMARAAQHSGAQVPEPLGWALRNHSIYPILQLASGAQGWTQEPRPHLQKWMVPLTLIPAPSPRGQSPIPASKAPQATLVEFPKGPQLPEPTSCRLDSGAGGGAVLGRRGPKPLPPPHPLGFSVVA